MRFDEWLSVIVFGVVAFAVAVYERKVPEYIRRPFQQMPPDQELKTYPSYRIIFTRPNDETANLPDGWRMTADWGGQQAILRDMAQRRLECEAMVKECGIESIESLPTIDKPALLVFGLFAVWFLSIQTNPVIRGFTELLADILAEIGSVIWPPIGRFIAKLIGWHADDWLMFRVFYEYYLIHDWDKRTFKHLIRREGSFWGWVFGRFLKLVFIGTPALGLFIGASLCTLDIETLKAGWKAFKDKYAPTCILWAASIGVLHYVYPFFVWWPRPILYFDYFFLLLGSALTTVTFKKFKAFLWEDIKAILLGEDPSPRKGSKVD